GKPVDADTRTFDEDSDITARVTRFVERYLPSALGPIVRMKTCLYAMTPDRDFIIDRLPEHPNVSVTVGGGHAFKFAAAIGKILSELALDGRASAARDGTELDLRAFAVDRPVLQTTNPPKTYML
ncbi:MAG TPA: FAD-dependent oxidoreductase, partial [Candidatus Cybelea sp.]|nr:FAD-dependent oxidoreductase [Candidatus Cybelea sp.]